MKIILFSGNHSRHFFLHSAIIERFNVIGVVLMERETQMPISNPSWTPEDRRLFDLHFEKRAEIEKKHFGHLNDSIYNGLNIISIKRDELNSKRVLDFVVSLDADVSIIFGVDIIKDSVFSALPDWKINVHLGLSPWYKGAATLFWPFYNLEPQNSGATLHLIAAKADAGEILHHSVPELSEGDSMHEHCAKVVIKATYDLIEIINKIKLGVPLTKHVQRSSGKLFLEKEFRPEHLRVVYDLFNDDISGMFLRGELNSRSLNLINHDK
jgi:methionyl-tRNA formyltransferase